MHCFPICLPTCYGLFSTYIFTGAGFCRPPQLGRTSSARTASSSILARRLCTSSGYCPVIVIVGSFQIFISRNRSIFAGSIQNDHEYEIIISGQVVSTQRHTIVIVIHFCYHEYKVIISGQAVSTRRPSLESFQNLQHSFLSRKKGENVCLFVCLDQPLNIEKLLIK